MAGEELVRWQVEIQRNKTVYLVLCITFIVCRSHDFMHCLDISDCVMITPAV